MFKVMGESEGRQSCSSCWQGVRGVSFLKVMGESEGRQSCSRLLGGGERRQLCSR